MFPGDRFEPSWTVPKPSEDACRVEARLPLGHPRASLAFVVWVDECGRLLHDWPGFPGTLGARVDVSWYRPGSGRITGTRDPALLALADPVPLTRRFAEKVNARCMVDYGLAPESAADFVACERHGHGIGALTCPCVAEAGGVPRNVWVFYDPDGDYPDVVCEACADRFVAKDAAVTVRVCSRCQQEHLYRHRILGRTHYGATALHPPLAGPE